MSYTNGFGCEFYPALPGREPEKEIQYYCLNFRSYSTKIWLKINFLVNFQQIHPIGVKTDGYLKFCWNILFIKEIKFLLEIYTKIRVPL